jgi:two-component system, NarL family, response regulator NreC
VRFRLSSQRTDRLNMLRIVLADDHKMVRQGFKTILSTHHGATVVAETGDGLEAVKLVEDLKPDLLVVDLSLPGLDGLEVTRRVKKKVPATRIIVLSMHADEGYVVSALRSGASGYVLKEAGPEELVEAVRLVMEGRQYLSSMLPAEEIRSLLKGGEAKAGDRYETLSSREREVLQLIAEGHSSPEISERLYISPRTVDTHRAKIIAKLGLRNVSDLIRFAVERGLIPPLNAPKREGENE